jgi:hypothetical protein
MNGRKKKKNRPITDFWKIHLQYEHLFTCFPTRRKVLHSVNAENPQRCLITVHSARTNIYKKSSISYRSSTPRPLSSWLTIRGEYFVHRKHLSRKIMLAKSEKKKKKIRETITSERGSVENEKPRSNGGTASNNIRNLSRRHPRSFRSTKI